MMRPLVRRLILAAATGRGGEHAQKLLDMLTEQNAMIPIMVRTVELVFSHAVIYDRVNGACCPACGQPSPVTRTCPVEEGAQFRCHFCERCQKAFRSVCRDLRPGRNPDPIDAPSSVRQTRRRKRRN